MRLPSIIQHLFSRLLLAACIGFAYYSSAAQADANPPPVLSRIESELEKGQYKSAGRLIDSLSEDQRETPFGRYLSGWMKIVQGEYDKALNLIKSAIEAEKTREEWKFLRDLASDSMMVTKRYERMIDPEGKFEIRYPPGVDRVLVPYAMDTLEAQDRFLIAHFGQEIHRPVVVEIISDSESLGTITGTEKTDLERTGTVAISHKGRILLLSPRALERGYPWLDTLAHELVHLYITTYSADRAPGWLHEGLARTLDSGWRSDETLSGKMTPVEEYLLDRAAREKRLLTLKRLNNPFIRLASQEESVLAMAQAASFTKYLGRRRGIEAYGQILGLLRDGKSISQAVNISWKIPFGRVYGWWVQSLEGRRLAPKAAVRLLGRRFRKGEIGVFLAHASFLDPQVTQKVRLGDLLLKRGHYSAAAVEYRRAADMAGDPDPVIVNKLARCEIVLGKPDDARKRLEQLAPLYPHFPATFMALAEAKKKLADPDGAYDAYMRTIALDPFDPAAACGISDVIGGEREKLRERFKAHCNELGIALVKK